MRSLQEIFQLVPASADKGLNPDAVERSRQQFGSNRLTPLPREPLWKKFLEKFDEPIIKILLAAALLSMVVDLFKDDEDSTSPFAALVSLNENTRYLIGGVAVGVIALAVVGAYLLRGSSWIPTILFGSALLLFALGSVLGHPSIEGMAVMVAVILATGVAFWMEYKSDREFEVLNAQKESQVVKVERGGHFHTVPLEDVVVGDLVLLEMGDEVPADGRLVRANDLYVDQSLMTGESEPVHKKAGHPDDATFSPQHRA
jgi:P-type Ca2+ transporter type 2C